MNSVHRSYSRTHSDQALATLRVWPADTHTAQGARDDLSRLITLAHHEALEEHAVRRLHSRMSY